MTIWERAVQHLYPMELTCSNCKAPKEVVLDPNARDFSPKRNATFAANERIKDVTDYETEVPDVEYICYFQYQIVGECSKGLELSGQELLHDINMLLEHRTFFERSLVEEVPRTF